MFQTTAKCMVLGIPEKAQLKLQGGQEIFRFYGT
jgi:hypothetical protein